MEVLGLKITTIGNDFTASTQERKQNPVLSSFSTILANTEIPPEKAPAIIDNPIIGLSAKGEPVRQHDTKKTFNAGVKSPEEVEQNKQALKVLMQQLQELILMYSMGKKTRSMVKAIEDKAKDIEALTGEKIDLSFISDLDEAKLNVNEEDAVPLMDKIQLALEQALFATDKEKQALIQKK